MRSAESTSRFGTWRGRFYEQPVSVLLGGAYHSTVPAYGSVLFGPVESLPDRIEAMKARNFHAIKLGWEPFGQGSLAEDEKLIKTARREGGDDMTLLIDAGGSTPYWKHRLKDALERTRMLAGYGVYWYEEALAPDDLEGYARLTDLSPVKIAHGEVLTRRESFIPYFDRRAMDIVQPDVAKVGGLSEIRRIAWMAEQRGIELVPHGWNTAVGVAADVHLVATLPSKSFVEFNVGNPLVEDLGGSRFTLNSEGHLAVPTTPGLGLRLTASGLNILRPPGMPASRGRGMKGADLNRNDQSIQGKD